MVFMYVSISVVTRVLLQQLTLSPNDMFYFILQSNFEVQDLLSFRMKVNQKMLLKSALTEHILLMDI